MAMKGKAHKFRDNVDTDVIIPARYLVTSDPQVLAQHCMEAIDPDFVNRVQPGDIMMGGTNFGCGSSREHAPISIRAAGIQCIVAKSFARIFFRNSINLGLPIVECPDAVDATESGDEVEVEVAQGEVRNLTKGLTFKLKPFEPFVMDILNAGGLIEYTKRKLQASSSSS